MLSRRGFFSVLCGAIAAPLIVPRASLMAMPRAPLLVLPTPTGLARFYDFRPAEILRDGVVRIKGLHSGVGDVVWMSGKPMLNLGNDLFKTFENWHMQHTWPLWRSAGAIGPMTGVSHDGSDRVIWPSGHFGLVNERF